MGSIGFCRLVESSTSRKFLLFRKAKHNVRVFRVFPVFQFSQFLRAARAGHHPIYWAASKGFRFNQWKTDNMQILAQNWSIRPYFNHHCHQLGETGRLHYNGSSSPTGQSQAGITDKIQWDGRAAQARNTSQEIQTGRTVHKYRYAGQLKNKDQKY